MKAVARMESFGIPVDLPLLKRLRADWQNASMDKQSQMQSNESLESLKGWQRNLGRLLIDYGMLIWSLRALRLKVWSQTRTVINYTSKIHLVRKLQKN